MIIKPQIQEAVDKFPLSMAEAARYLKLPFGTFKYNAIKFGLYKPNQNHRGRKLPNKGRTRIPLTEILEGKHPTYKTYHLNKRLIEEGIKQYICEECDIKDWSGKPLTLELDHIDGNSTNHRLENLRMICPNCHSQTPTFRNKTRNGDMVELGRHERLKIVC